MSWSSDDYRVSGTEQEETLLAQRQEQQRQQVLTSALDVHHFKLFGKTTFLPVKFSKKVFNYRKLMLNDWLRKQIIFTIANYKEENLDLPLEMQGLAQMCDCEFRFWRVESWIYFNQFYNSPT
ncbi:Oidioi.mRNA.OKI2018_I69.PAR.g12086.t1.cds [Oikopleura dioica]|uniref:Oidioi.mRNA.OKI2018_I69.PAR.g12086.t1.cds n=1 Tax=Oikopleura dioica TaxID=34765 RepID=A0ABN7RZ22_OIKDI|nr:Oidioi.mRNA.OKI2018_I69.PAR.g12086.t1.cds [Oikopleura dioica]